MHPVGSWWSRGLNLAGTGSPSKPPRTAPGAAPRQWTSSGRDYPRDLVHAVLEDGLQARGGTLRRSRQASTRTSSRPLRRSLPPHRARLPTSTAAALRIGGNWPRGTTERLERHLQHESKKHGAYGPRLGQHRQRRPRFKERPASCQRKADSAAAKISLRGPRR